MPRGFRSNRRVSTVRIQQIQALEQIRKSQCQLYSLENKANHQEVKKECEIHPMKDLSPNMVPSNDYSIVGHDLPYDENMQRQVYKLLLVSI